MSSIPQGGAMTPAVAEETCTVSSLSETSSLTGISVSHEELLHMVAFFVNLSSAAARSSNRANKEVEEFQVCS